MSPNEKTGGYSLNNGEKLKKSRAVKEDLDTPRTGEENEISAL